MEDMAKRKLQPGDRVRYGIGKGVSTATLVKIEDGTATLRTDNGKTLNRKEGSIEKAPPEAN